MIDDEFSQEEIDAYIRKRLTCPIVLAELFVIVTLHNKYDEQVITKVRKHSAAIQNQFWLCVTLKHQKVQTNLINYFLHFHLKLFYAGLPMLVPGLEFSHLKKRILLFPKDSPIDWQELLVRFLDFEGDDEKQFDFIHPKELEFYKTLAYVTAYQELLRIGQSFDQAAIDIALASFEKNVRDAAHSYDKMYWAQFDHPPFQRNILWLQTMITEMKFQIKQAEISGVMPSVPKFFKQELSPEHFIRILTGRLELYTLKQEGLLHQKALEEFDAIEQANSLSNKGLVQTKEEATFDSRTALSNTEAVLLKENAEQVAKPPKIKIDFDQVDLLFTALKDFVQPKDIEKLQLVLKGNQITSPILIIDCKLNAWVLVFRQAHNANYISNNKIEIAEWIAHWFRIGSASDPQEIKQGTVTSYLKPSRRTAKNKRISYKQ
ncbi:hypothetical protein [Spirosoma sp.]|uniref:hypothetical protein n=1 Tax=Spirosoma sp. TaxID=1899569 RepID=UPI003B3A62AB